MKPDIFSESRFLTIPSAFERFDATVRGVGSRRSIAMTFGTEKPPDREKNLSLRLLILTLTEFTIVTDRRTDGQTDKA